MWYLRNGRSVFDRVERPSDDTRIYRPSTSRPPVVVAAGTSSAVSSTASVGASECGSTTLLLPQRGQRPAQHLHRDKDTHKPSCRHHPRDGNMRELNLLLTTPHVPDLREKDVKKSEPHESPGDCVQEVPVQEPEDEEETVIHLGPQVMAALSVSLGSMVVGFASAYTSPALVSMMEIDSPVHVTDQEASWIGSLMPLSALLGGIAGGPLIEGLGRRTTILGTAVPFIVSWFLIAMASNVGMILAGRAIAGFCVGIASLSLPVYLGETVQPEVRGMLGLMPTTLGNVGILTCFVAGNYLDWTTLAMLGGCIPVPFLICMFLIPETPRWYASKNKPKRARKALQWLRGKDADISSEMAEIDKAAAEAEKSSADSSRCSELFNKSNLRPLLISVGLMFFQQMSGINAVIFYTVQIFKDAGSTIDGNLCTIIVGIVNFLSTFVATMLIDRLGRKILLYVSSVAMVITLNTLGAFFYLKGPLQVDVSAYGWVPLASFVIFVVGFSIGFGPIPWLMMGEVLPAKIRGSAASLATAFNWSCVFIVTKTFADLTSSIGSYGAFWMFGSVAFVGLFFVIFFVPETQGKSLEDIEKKLTGIKIRRMSSIANLKPLPMAV